MNHIHVSVNGETVFDETQNNFSNINVQEFNEFGHNIQTTPFKDSDTFYYDGLFGDVHLIKKSGWIYRLTQLIWGLCFFIVFICLLPYLLVFSAVIFAIIAKLFGF
jgi:hypothetical protein